MTAASKSLQARLLSLPRWGKRLLLIGNDLVLLSFALWAAFCLRLGYLYVPPDLEFTLLLSTAPVIGVVVFYYRGLYRLVTRYIAQEAATRLYITVAIAVLLWSLVILMTGIIGVPRSVVIMYGLIAAFLIRLSRYAAGGLLKTVPGATPASFDPRIKVVIYGAGETGLQLLQELKNNTQYRPIALIDDDKSLWGQIIGGVKVYRSEKIAKLIERDGIKEVLLAMPSASRRRLRHVIRGLEHLPVVVKTLPALADIAAGRVTVNDLRPIDVEDLLGRDPVPPDRALLSRDIRGKSVLITGAGGTIGAELTRQVLSQRPKKLILFEHSELALYEIGMETQTALAARRGAKPDDPAHDIEIVQVLGSVLDRQVVRQVLSTHGVDTIYHAAAYKHVPIVEANPAAGLWNNTFGTLVVAEEANALGVPRFVLISTDKAVRPTGIMGASKRMAELILQGLAAEAETRTMFTMVRFGNVLDSSGSVVRRFRNQIGDGGPITVTHRDMIRYFMSIPEAAQLVLQAGALAEGGDVFVLDMGQPVKIDDLARTMIRLSGLEVQDDDNPDGDIAIEYVGLRRGEKLYEEPLMGEGATGTEHPRIMKDSEPFLPLADLREELDRLEAAVQTNDVDAMKTVLKRTVEGYTAGEQPFEAQPGEAGEWTSISRTLH